MPDFRDLQKGTPRLVKTETEGDSYFSAQRRAMGTSPSLVGVFQKFKQFHITHNVQAHHSDDTCE